MDINIPILADLRINLFSGASITQMESGSTNGMAEEKNGVIYLTQRPSIDVFEDAGTAGGAARGRAIQYWDETGGIYILNDGTLYKDTQASSISTSPTAGTKKCTFLEIGTTLVLLDAENDEGWTINTSDVVASISDADFPPNIGTPVGIAFGGAVLNNVLYVLGENGRVYGSDDGDPTSWNALNFLGATRDNDGGTYLGKHHAHIMAAGPASMEFFEDRGNPTGSPLGRRQDVFYSIGISSGESVWEIGDQMFFVGVNESGALGVYLLQTFSVNLISNSTIDSFLTQAIVRDGYSAVGSGFSAHGRNFYILTLYTTPTDPTPAITLVYDQKSNFWHPWETTVNGLTNFPVVSWTKRIGDTERVGEGILMNGDLITVNDNLIPQDTLGASSYVATGYVAANYVLGIGESGTSISLTARTGMYDGATNKYKYPESLRFGGDRTLNSQNLSISWSNEDSDSFNTARTIDMSKNDKLTRLGRFQRRNHELSYSGSEQVRIERLALPLEVGFD